MKCNTNLNEKYDYGRNKKNGEASLRRNCIFSYTTNTHYSIRCSEDYNEHKKLTSNSLKPNKHRFHERWQGNI